MVKSPSLIVGCLFPNSVMMLVVPTTKTPVISTFPLIEPPVSSNLLSNAVCNPDVFAMVKSLSCISLMLKKHHWLELVSTPKYQTAYIFHK